MHLPYYAATVRLQHEFVLRHIFGLFACLREEMPQLSCFVASVWSLIFLVLLSTVSGQASGPSSRVQSLFEQVALHPHRAMPRGHSLPPYRL
jgi:hypothetical protein